MYGVLENYCFQVLRTCVLVEFLKIHLTRFFLSIYHWHFSQKCLLKLLLQNGVHFMLGFIHSLLNMEFSPLNFWRFWIMNKNICLRSNCYFARRAIAVRRSYLCAFYIHNIKYGFLQSAWCRNFAPMTWFLPQKPFFACVWINRDRFL